MKKLFKKTAQNFNSVRNKVTGKEKDEALKKYFNIFEEILSGMHTRLTEQQSQVNNLRKKIDQLESELKAEKNANIEIPASAPPKILTYVALFIAMVALGISILLLVS
jgi:uncharacterized coiled-coil protein SlyX